MQTHDLKGIIYCFFLHIFSFVLTNKKFFRTLIITKERYEVNCTGADNFMQQSELKPTSTSLHGNQRGKFVVSFFNDFLFLWLTIFNHRIVKKNVRWKLAQKRFNKQSIVRSFFNKNI